MEHEDENVVVIRGLPYGSTEEDIREFFEGLDIAPNGIDLWRNQYGKHFGCASVKFVNDSMAEQALQNDQKKMGSRYIEVYKSNDYQGKMIQTRFGRKTHYQDHTADFPFEHIVKLRGLSYDVEEADVELFFAGLNIAPDGIRVVKFPDGKCSGIGFVAFVDEENLEQALLRHKSYLGNRYIEITKSHEQEAESTLSWKSRRFGGFGMNRHVRGGYNSVLNDDSNDQRPGFLGIVNKRGICMCHGSVANLSRHYRTQITSNPAEMKSILTLSLANALPESFKLVKNGRESEAIKEENMHLTAWSEAADGIKIMNTNLRPVHTSCLRVVRSLLPMLKKLK